MRYEKRILAFVDILAFSEEIKSTIDKNTGEEIELKTEKINQLFEKVLAINKKKYFQDNVKSKKLSHFSDSVAISYLLGEEAGILHVLFDIMYFCISAFQDGFLIRGAITYGDLHHSDNKLYGPAMLTAYDMEKKLAFYPRVVFEKKIMDIVNENLVKWPSKFDQLVILKKIIEKDFDGLYYLNYFNSIDFIFGATEGFLVFFKLFREKIIEMQKKIENDNSIKSKYLWLREKYYIALKNSTRKYLKPKIKLEFPKLYNFLKDEADIMDYF